MKTILPVLFLILSCEILAQGGHKYIPFPDSNAVWMVERFDEFGKSKGGRNFYYVGDTIINSLEYHITIGINDSTFPIPPPTIFGWLGIRNDTTQRKVFVFDYIADKEYLLYDFSLSVGDTIGLGWLGTHGYGTQVVTNIDTVTINGNEHFVFYVDNKMGIVYPYVEGIGSLAGLFDSPYLFEGSRRLNCFKPGLYEPPYFVAPGSQCDFFHHSSIAELNGIDGKIIVQPNPITINSKVMFKGLNGGIDFIEIYNQRGELIKRANVNGDNIQIGNLIRVNGMYFLKVILTTDEYVSLKIVKH